jgi:hypothetical protein
MIARTSTVNHPAQRRLKTSRKPAVDESEDRMIPGKGANQPPANKSIQPFGFRPGEGLRRRRSTVAGDFLIALPPRAFMLFGSFHER